MVRPQPSSTIPTRPAQPIGVQQVPSPKQTCDDGQGAHTFV
jgi:hypothetical protein